MPTQPKPAAREPTETEYAAEALDYLLRRRYLTVLELARLLSEGAAGEDSTELFLANADSAVRRLTPRLPCSIVLQRRRCR